MTSALATAYRRLTTERDYVIPEELVEDEPDEEEPPPPKFVTLKMRGKEVAISVECEAIATDGYAIHMVSAVGSASSVKSLAAGLRMPELVRFVCDDSPVKLSAEGLNGVLRGASEGWEVHKHLLGMNTWHLLAWSKWGKLLVAGDDETLWQRLRSSDYTTPILRSWMTPIRQQLMEHNLLQQMQCFGCSCHYLSATDVGLDKIVSEGVLSGHLKLE